MRAWSRLGILSILLLACAIAFFRLDARTLHGDELGSVFEAERLGVNANSLVYFALLRSWVELGRTEYWLRALTALIAVSAVALSYAALRSLSGERAALVAALLFATSPFLIAYSQQIRFYSVALFTASLSLYFFARCLRPQSTRHDQIAWLLSAALAIASLFLNALLVLGQAITLFVFSHRFSSRVKIIIGLAVVLLGVTLVAIPSVRAMGFNLLARYTNSVRVYDASRGLALSHFVKIPLTLYFFIFGESVYPFDLWLVVPGLALFGVALVLGLKNLARTPRAFWFAVIASITALGLLYLVFDPLVPLVQQGAAPRYLVFLLPIFCWVGASGARSRWLLAGLLLVNFISLGNYFFGDWSYTDDRVNWRAVTRWVAPFVTPQTIFLLDGQAQPFAAYYFPTEWNRQSLSGTLNPNSPRVIMLSYNWHPEARVPTTAALESIALDYTPIAALTQYPLFVFVYERGSDALALPSEIYGLEFQDLRLPVSVAINGRVTTLLNAFGLPRLDGANAQTIRLAHPTRARRLALLSTVTNARDARDGTVIATLRVSGGNIEPSIPLRLAYETNAWDQNSCVANCRAAYQWRKRFAFVGFQGYPDAWRDFTASIFVSELDLPSDALISKLEFQRVPSPGELYIWGLVLEP